MTPEIFSTTRKRMRLLENGYVYLFDKMSTDGQRNFWRCEKKAFCPARIHTDAKTNEVCYKSDNNHFYWVSIRLNL